MLKTSSSLFVRATLGVALGLAVGGASAAAPSATNGATVYANKGCAGCHGVAPFTANQSLIKNGVAASSTKNAVYGMPKTGGGTMGGGQMGHLTTMTDSDYDDLAAYIAQQAGGTATCTSTGVPTAATPATTAACGTTTTPAPAPAATSSGGGCTLGAADQPFDPLWLLMLGGAALVWRRRASRQAV